MTCNCWSCRNWRQIIANKKRYTAKQLDLKRSRFRTKAAYINWLKGQMRKDCTRGSKC